ncbi:MAG TPA: porin [Alphaproteobacteria bacterium]|jgi:hypothetical protein
MKKLLLGTTALVGASFAATAALAAPEVRLGGYMDFQAGFSSQDVDGWSPSPGVPGVAGGDRGFGFVTDTELLIRASDKLDNGLRWAVKIEMEADSQDRAVGTAKTNNEQNADEVTMVFSGTWGELTLGNEDGPSDSMNMAADSAISGLGLGASKGYRRWVNTTSFDNDLYTKVADVTDTNDATKVMYYTPTIAGFQFGVSYTANDGDSGRIRASDNAGAPTASQSQNYENWIETGLTYEFKVDEIGFGLAATYNHADAQNTTVTDDVNGYSLSGKVEFGGFLVSLGYASENGVGDDKDVTVSGYGGGVKYTTGPYQIGVGYMHNMQDNPVGTAGGADFTSDTATLGVAYRLGAGVSLYADSWYYTNDSDGFAPEDENQAIGLLVGTQITF